MPLTTTIEQIRTMIAEEVYYWEVLTGNPKAESSEIYRFCWPILYRGKSLAPDVTFPEKNIQDDSTLELEYQLLMPK